ncbi:MAG: ribosome maturation factor RimP [Pseudomonadota bacterium]|nr:ribosome maturation factor RimP [Pseudomonadota bacterium]
MRLEDSKLARLVRTVVEPMGYELVGVEYFQRGKGAALLRVYIDHEKGITLDDCSAVSHQLSGVLDVEDPLPGHYDLEVSSPGLERPLFEAEHYERFCGRKARIKLATKLDGRRKLEGVLAGVKEETVLLEVDGETREIPFAVIESARLIPEF